MSVLKTRKLLVPILTLILAYISQPAFGAAASITKSVTPLEDGKFLIKLKVSASESSIYALRLVDPEASIVNVYAPRGWCAVTDGQDYLARTSSDPLERGKPVEFILHSTTDKVRYTWSVYGRMKQLGNPEAI